MSPDCPGASQTTLIRVIDHPTSSPFPVSFLSTAHDIFTAQPCPLRDRHLPLPLLIIISPHTKDKPARRHV